MSTRLAKVAEMIKVEIADIIQREMKDPRAGFTTITSVEVTPDLRNARVFVSIMGDEAQKAAGMKALKSAAGFIRAELGKRIRMRATPILEFRVDESIDRGMRMFELLQQINKDESEKQ